VPVNTGSKNALDFQLTTHLGYLIGKGEHSGAAYRIVSNDTGFDCVVTYWKDKGIDIARIIDLAGSEKNVSQPKKKSQTRQKRGEKQKAETEPQAKPEPKQKAETEPQAKPESKQKAKTNPKAKNESKQKAESEPQQKNEPAQKAEPMPQQNTAPAPKSTPEQKAAPKKKNAKKTSKGIISTTKAEMLQYLDPDEYEDGLLDIFNGYKSRTTINNYFAKHFRDSQKASVIYKKLKPLMAAKEKS
jgi:flagellar biosynthesis GTPase FlhF